MIPYLFTKGDGWPNTVDNDERGEAIAAIIIYCPTPGVADSHSATMARAGSGTISAPTSRTDEGQH